MSAVRETIPPITGEEIKVKVLRGKPKEVEEKEQENPPQEKVEE